MHRWSFNLLYCSKMVLISIKISALSVIYYTKKLKDGITKFLKDFVMISLEHINKEKIVKYKKLRTLHLPGFKMPKTMNKEKKNVIYHFCKEREDISSLFLEDPECDFIRSVV